MLAEENLTKSAVRFWLVPCQKCSRLHHSAGGSLSDVDVDQIAEKATLGSVDTSDHLQRGSRFFVVSTSTRNRRQDKKSSSSVISTLPPCGSLPLQTAERHMGMHRHIPTKISYAVALNLLVKTRRREDLSET
jgi:hypothetical protein